MPNGADREFLAMCQRGLRPLEQSELIRLIRLANANPLPFNASSKPLLVQIASLRLDLSEARAEIEHLKTVLQLIAGRICGSDCTERYKDGKERYPDVRDRCARCVAIAAIAETPVTSPACTLVT